MYKTRARRQALSEAKERQDPSLVCPNLPGCSLLTRRGRDGGHSVTHGLAEIAIKIKTRTYLGNPDPHLAQTTDTDDPHSLASSLDPPVTERRVPGGERVPGADLADRLTW